MQNSSWGGSVVTEHHTNLRSPCRSDGGGLDLDKLARVAQDSDPEQDAGRVVAAEEADHSSQALTRSPRSVLAT
jgi:hypothetical protein